MRKIFLAGLLALVAGTAHAGENELPGVLRRMAQASGPDYLEARGRLASIEGARSALERRLEGAVWTEASFHELAIATIAHAHLARPDVVAKVNALRGLDPAHYTKARRPEPEATRDLRAIGRPAAGALLELYLKTFESYPFSKCERAAKERAALREGIVIMLSEWQHPSAFFVCKAVASCTEEKPGARRQAIEGLGAVGTPEALAELRRLHAAAEGDDLRLATLRGVALVPSGDALAFLGEQLASKDCKAAVTAIGTFGSAWGWEARGREVAETTGAKLREQASVTLLGAFSRLAAECPDALVEALATIADPASVERLAAGKCAVARRAHDRVKMAVDRNRK